MSKKARRKLKKNKTIRLKRMKVRVLGIPKPMWVTIQCLALFSCLAMTTSVTLQGTAFAGAIGVGLSFVLCVWSFFFQRHLENIVIGFSPVCGVLAVPYAVSASKIFTAYFYFRFERIVNVVIAFLSNTMHRELSLSGVAHDRIKSVYGYVIVFALWMAVYMMLNWFRTFVWPVIRPVSGLEIAYFSAMALVCIALILMLYRSTNMFYFPAADNKTALSHVVYGARSGELMQADVFVNMNASVNGILYVLYGLFSMPFGITASWIASAFGGDLAAYGTSIAVLQSLSLLLAMLLISRLLELEDIDQLCFLLLFFTTYPILLHLLLVERADFSFLWIALYLYAICKEKPDKQGMRQLAYTASAGGFLLSGLLLPLSIESGGWKHNGKLLLHQVFLFLTTVIAFGQFPVLVMSTGQWADLGSMFDTALPFMEKVRYYLTFLQGCVVAPGEAAVSIGRFRLTTYQLSAVTDWSRIGAAVLLLSVLGFVLNGKDRYCRICFAWMAVSFCLFCLCGWDLAESSRIGYSLYVSWSALSLIYMGIRKMTASHSIIRIVISCVLFVFLAAINIKSLRELILFSLRYYPR